MSHTALLPATHAGVCPLLAPPVEVAHGIVSQAVLSAPGVRISLFHFTAGQEMSRHTSSARALVQVLAGCGDFEFHGQTRQLRQGDLLHLPPQLPHAVRAVHDMTLLLTQVEMPET